MLRRFRADLHVHTCLSPCGDLRMSPRNIATEAGKRGILLLAVCDHNSAENVAAVMKAAEAGSVTVLPGMEVCSREEIHVLAIFEDLESVLDLQSTVYAHLKGRNDPEAFGLQVVANELDEVIGYQDSLLIGAVDLPIEDIVDTIHGLGGVAVASHIDRESFSVTSQLGFIPETLKFDALELSCNIGDDEARRRFVAYGDATFVRNSDAHELKDLGKNTSEYMLDHPSFQEIQKAFAKQDGRMICAA
jgi:3',5'-nucleoside bisphosphate phosphatase